MNTSREGGRNIAKMRRTQGCLTDSVAYYFNVHPENVPFFVYPRKNWMRRLRTYFKKHDKGIFWHKEKTPPKKGTFIVCGDSLKYKTFAHVVVYKNGKLAYDPDYPSKWSTKRITHWLEVFPLKPWPPSRCMRWGSSKTSTALGTWSMGDNFLCGFLGVI